MERCWIGNFRDRWLGRPSHPFQKRGFSLLRDKQHWQHLSISRGHKRCQSVQCNGPEQNFSTLQGSRRHFTIATCPNYSVRNRFILPSRLESSAWILRICHTTQPARIHTDLHSRIQRQVWRAVKCKRWPALLPHSSHTSSTHNSRYGASALRVLEDCAAATAVADSVAAGACAYALHCNWMNPYRVVLTTNCNLKTYFHGRENHFSSLIAPL